jgi:hypothetical protein
LPAIIAGNRVDTLVTPHGIWPATLQPRSAPTLGLPNVFEPGNLTNGG